MKFLQPKHTISIAPATIVFVVLFLLSLYFLFMIRGVIFLLFLSFLVMTALRPGAHKLHVRYKLPRTLSIFLMYTLMLAVIGVFLSLILPPLFFELQNLLRALNLPVLQSRLSEFRFTIGDINGLVSSLGSSVSTLTTIVFSTFSGLFTVFTLLVLSFYMLLDRPRLHKRVAWFTKDPRHLELAESFLNQVELQLGGWIRGEIVLISVVALMTYIGLTLLKMPYALPMALLTGLMDLLPNIGPTIATVPAVVIAYLVAGPVTAGMVLIFYIVVQQLENNIIVPKVMKANADVSPLATIVTILIGFEVSGVMGALAAIPVYIVLRSAYSFWLKELR